jgi:hypothetical protein
MARSSDPSTSHEAAEAVRPQLGKIHALVIEVYHSVGAMSAREAERRPEFGDYGFSTIRKRISELANMGVLEAVGEESRTGKTPATVYQILKLRGNDE